MVHTHRLILFTLLSLALVSCAGEDGATGPQGPQGEQGPPGEATQVQDLDAIAQMLAEDPQFRAQLAQLLVEQHAAELKGEDGMPGECSCDDTSAEGRSPRCVSPCESAADCSTGQADEDEDNWTCEAGGCVWLGCLTDDECEAARPGRGFVCR